MWSRDKKAEEVSALEQQGEAVRRRTEFHRTVLDQEKADRQRGTEFSNREITTGAGTEVRVDRVVDNLVNSTDRLTRSFTKLNDVASETATRPKTGIHQTASASEEDIILQLINARQPINERNIALARKQMEESKWRALEAPLRTPINDNINRLRNIRDQLANPAESRWDTLRSRMNPSEGINPNRMRDFIAHFDEQQRHRLRGQARRAAYKRARRRSRHMAYFHARQAKAQGWKNILRTGRTGLPLGLGGGYGYRGLARGNLYGIGRMALGLAGRVLGSAPGLTAMAFSLPEILAAMSGGIAEHNRPSARYNASIAGAFASYDFGQFRRAMDLADRTAGTTIDLLAAQGAAANALQPAYVATRNTLNTLGIGLARGAGAAAMHLEPYYNVWNQLVTSEAGQTFVKRGSAAGGAALGGAIEAGAWGMGIGTMVGGPGFGLLTGGIAAGAAAVFYGVQELITGEKAKKQEEEEEKEREFARTFGKRQAAFLETSQGWNDRFTPIKVHFAK